MKAAAERKRWSGSTSVCEKINAENITPFLIHCRGLKAVTTATNTPRFVVAAGEPASADPTAPWSPLIKTASSPRVEWPLRPGRRAHRQSLGPGASTSRSHEAEG